MKLGEYIRQLREKRDLSLREFALKIGKSPAFISDIELGKRNPGKDFLIEIASFFDVATSDLEKYDQRVPVEHVKKAIQTTKGAALIGFALRKVNDKKITEQDMIELRNIFTEVKKD